MPSGVVRQSGLGLIEVVISLLLLSLASLGMSKMQLYSQGQVSEAMQRSQASYLAMDILQRIRADRLPYRIYRTDAGGSIVREPPECDKPCSVETIWQQEIQAWQQAIHEGGQLLEGAGCLQGAADQLRVTVSWTSTVMDAPTVVDDCGIEGVREQVSLLVPWVVVG
jgi:type IV pilus assembly protein PilV